MYQSQEINEIAEALSKAQGMFPVLEKKTQGYGYKYADLAETINAISEPLKENGLSIFHQIIAEEHPKLITRLLHSSGQWLSTEIPLFFRAEGKTNQMQAFGSAITYAKRYAIGCLLNLAADKEIDDDGAKCEIVPTKTSAIKEKVKLPVITPEQASQIQKCLEEFPSAREDMFRALGVEFIDQIPFDKFYGVMKTFEKRRLEKLGVSNE